jgi:hypothetical protein
VQRNLGSTVVGIIVAAIVIVWIASDPPPGQTLGEDALARLESAPLEEEQSLAPIAPTLPPPSAPLETPAVVPDAPDDVALTRWTGRVKLGSGASAVGVGVFEVRTADGRVRGVPCDASGAFETELPIGEYAATLWTSRGDTELAKVVLAGASVVRDVVVPGIELAGRVDFEGAARDSDALGLQVWIRNLATERKSLASRGADGKSYACFGLEPGEYAITTFPHALLDGGADGMRVTLDASPDLVALDLKVAAP